MDVKKEEIEVKPSIPQKDQYPNKEFTSEKEIAIEFAMQVHKKFDKLVKASILFGSQTKHSATATSDIDIVLIVDDASINWDIELVAWYREELAKLISSNKYQNELHINTVKLTTWWQDLLYGDPVIINILRYGEALIDSGGFFLPIKALLAQGKIRSTPEAVYTALQRAPIHLARSKAAEISAIEGVYWSMIDSSQAALITAGKVPPSPEHIPMLLKDAFVDRGMLDINSVRNLRDLYLLHKSIMHGEIKNVKGAEIDIWQEKAEKFIGEMTNIIAKILDAEKNKK
ncbi:MAG: nucleotidyltransferase domain-containing protein [Nanoarchaeota archaeon]|nr:nucleotidyltransferase domain-containing protein [Nanoarchaeota archaeon]